MLAAMKSPVKTLKNTVRAIFNRSRLWQPARVQPEASQPSPPPVGLCEFPLELLTMILEELDWRDVLRVRMVCKALQEVSKTRSVWLNLCRPHLSPTAIAPQTLHLERPIKLYTSHDLEFLFLRLKSADIGCRTDGKPPVRRRNIETTNVANSMHLVEGGRWLLVASNTGSIAYFDLDASTPTETILIPDQFEPPIRDQFGYLPEIRIVMAVDMDNDSAFLEFNLFLSFSIDDPPPDPKAHGVQIWKVSLALNDQQQGVGFVAEQLASFPLEPTVSAIFCQSILGDHIALTLLSDQHEESTLTFVLDWKQADGDRTNYPRRLLNPQYGKATYAIHLLPDHKLFTVSYDGVMFFEYLNIPETTSLPAFDFTTTTAVPLWTVSNFRTSERQSSVSRPFFCSHSIRFSIRGGHDIHGVIIDYPYNDDPTEPLGEVVKLMETDDILMISRESQGYTKATILSSKGDTYFANFSWPDEGNDDLPPLLLHKEDALGICSFGPFFDEESGRVVLSHAHNHDIWDFAHNNSS